MLQNDNLAALQLEGNFGNEEPWTVYPSLPSHSTDVSSRNSQSFDYHL